MLSVCLSVEGGQSRKTGKEEWRGGAESPGEHRQGEWQTKTLFLFTNRILFHIKSTGCGIQGTACYNLCQTSKFNCHALRRFGVRTREQLELARLQHPFHAVAVHLE